MFGKDFLAKMRKKYVFWHIICKMIDRSILLKPFTMRVSEMIQQYYPEYYSIESYPAAQTVCIRKTSDEWGILGNFAQAPIVVDGVTFDCTERLFQMMKLRPDATEGIHDMMNIGGGLRMVSRPLAKHGGRCHEVLPYAEVRAMRGVP